MTEWLNDYSNPLQGVDPRDPKAQTIVPQNLQHAREAIEAIGTNAIPTLLDLAQSPLPAKRDLAYTGFVVLGPKGSSARQQLIQLTQHPDSDIRMLAAKCLIAINPADKSTLIPIYTKLASDPDAGNRREATNMLQLLKFDPAKASLEKFK